MSKTAPQLLPRLKRYFPDRYTQVLQCSVVDINMKSWTVDVVNKLDGRYFADVQVGALYLHQHSGEGVFCMPEVGAVCMLCLPTDTSGPFVMAYVSPGQTTKAGQEVDARKQGMTSSEYEDYSKKPPPPNKDIDYTYSSNRQVAKPGDIVLQGRDGNFCRLHRGGVLEIGASELAQRIYVPLTNMITDVSEHYEHHNVAGTVRWGMQPLDYEDRETWWRQTFRVNADDKYCDMRLTCGNVTDKVSIPDGDKDRQADPTKSPLVYELALIPASSTSGFAGVEGEVVGASHNQLKMLFKFDRQGNCYLRADGDGLMTFKKSLFIRVDGPFTVRASSINMTASGDVTIGTQAGLTNVDGKLVKLAGGGVGVARLSDMVMIPGVQVLEFLALVLKTDAFLPSAATAAVGLSLQGAITTSSQKTESA